MTKQENDAVKVGRAMIGVVAYGGERNGRRRWMWKESDTVWATLGCRRYSYKSIVLAPL